MSGMLRILVREEVREQGDDDMSPLCKALEEILAQHAVAILACWQFQIENACGCQHEVHLGESLVGMAHPNAFEVKKKHPELWPTGSLDDLFDEDEEPEPCVRCKKAPGKCCCTGGPLYEEGRDEIR